MARATIGAAAGILLALVGTSAKADLAISSKPTENVSCSAGVCTATAKKAVLNVDELTGMLASSDVTVTTGGIAKGIDVTAALSWASASRLTLDADKSLIVKQPVTVAGSGALTISTNGGHHAVDLEFFGKGSVQFWDLSSSLVINGKSYTLVGDIATLAADIAANASGSYALAKSYDASVDGTYSSSPIPTTFNGTLEGLGNAIWNLTIRFAIDQNTSVGLFTFIGIPGGIRNFGIKANLQSMNEVGSIGGIGALAAGSLGWIDRCWTFTEIKLVGGHGGQIGGLAGFNEGTISNSHASAKIDGENDSANIGALVGTNDAIITVAYAKGAVAAAHGNRVGGLVGVNDGSLANTFAFTSIFERHRCCGVGELGGLIGENGSEATVTSSYSTGSVGAKNDSGDKIGGLIGLDAASSGSLVSTYWDLDSSGITDPSQGAGNVANDSGITGLTTAQFQAGLPIGFDPKIWGQSPSINDGFPFLLAVPPK